MAASSGTSLSASVASSGPGAQISREEALSVQLAECFGLPVENLEAALHDLDPEVLAVYLACDHAPVVRLRETWRLDCRRIDIKLLSECLLAPEGRICAALALAFERMSDAELAPELLLLDQLRLAKGAIVEAWTCAMEFAAPHGYVTSDDGYQIGIGEAVYRTLLAHCGRSSIEALPREEFLRLAPLLVETWPVTEDGLRSLLKLLHEIEEYIFVHRHRNDALTGEASA